MNCPICKDPRLTEEHVAQIERDLHDDEKRCPACDETYGVAKEETGFEE